MKSAKYSYCFLEDTDSAVINKRQKYRYQQCHTHKLYPESSEYSQIYNTLSQLMKHGTKLIQRIYNVKNNHKNISLSVEEVTGVPLMDFIKLGDKNNNLFLNASYSQFNQSNNKLKSICECYETDFSASKKQKYSEFTNGIHTFSSMIFSNTQADKYVIEENDQLQSANQQNYISQEDFNESVHQILCQLIQLVIYMIKQYLPLECLLKPDRLKIVYDKNNSIQVKLVDYFDIETLRQIHNYQYHIKKAKQFSTGSLLEKINFKEIFSLLQLIFIPEYKRYSLINENVNKINTCGYVLNHQLHIRTIVLLQQLYVSNGKIGHLSQLLEKQKSLPTQSLSDIINSNCKNFYVKIMIDGSSHEQIQNFIGKLTGEYSQQKDIYTMTLNPNSLHIHVIFYNKQNFIKQQLTDISQDVDINIQLYQSQQEYNTLNSKAMDIKAMNPKCEFFQLYIYDDTYDENLKIYAHQSFGPYAKRSLLQACIIHFIYLTYINKKYQ